VHIAIPKPYAFLILVLTLTACRFDRGDIEMKDYYYSGDKKQYFRESDDWLTVQVGEDDLEKFLDMNLGSMSIYVRKALIPERGFFWLEQENGRPIDPYLILLEKEVTILRTFPAFFVFNEKGEKVHYIMTDIFHVRFRDDISEEEIMEMNRLHQVEIMRTMDENEYLLRLTEESSYNTLEVANLYYEDSLTIWSLPDFFVPLQQ
jgi:hypothetical protein